MKLLWFFQELETNGFFWIAALASALQNCMFGIGTQFASSLNLTTFAVNSNQLRFYRVLSLTFEFQLLAHSILSNIFADSASTSESKSSQYLIWKQVIFARMNTKEDHEVSGKFIKTISFLQTSFLNILWRMYVQQVPYICNNMLFIKDDRMMTAATSCHFTIKSLNFVACLFCAPIQKQIERVD